MTEVKN